MDHILNIDLLEFVLSVGKKGGEDEWWLLQCHNALMVNGIERKADLLGLDFDDLNLDLVNPALKHSQKVWLRRVIVDVNIDWKSLIAKGKSVRTRIQEIGRKRYSTKAFQDTACMMHGMLCREERASRQDRGDDSDSEGEFSNQQPSKERLAEIPFACQVIQEKWQRKRAE